MRLRQCFFAVAAGLALLVGCGDAPSEPISRDAFIDVIIALRQAADGVRDSAVFAARRDEILRAHGVSDSMLIQYVRRHSRDVQMMAEIWDTIDARLAVPSDTMS